VFTLVWPTAKYVRHIDDLLPNESNISKNKASSLISATTQNLLKNRKIIRNFSIFIVREKLKDEG